MLSHIWNSAGGQVNLREAMASNGKVYSDCHYASNPYHECTDYCLKKIAEGQGKKEGHVKKDKKKSGSPN